MVWVDFRGTGMSTEEIESFIDQKAHIGVDKDPGLGRAEKVICGLIWHAQGRSLIVLFISWKLH